MEYLNQIEELKKDIAELQYFQSQAASQNVKNILCLDIRKLSDDLERLEGIVKKQSAAPSTSNNAASTEKKYEIKISNYAWYQTDESVVFQVSLANVHDLEPDKIHCEFTPKSFNMTVKDLQNKDYSLVITNLFEPINPSKSKWKIKKDKVVITLAKTRSNEWDHVTKWQKKTSDTLKDIDFEDDSTSLNDKLANLMRDMYEKGDDETKKSIVKAMTRDFKNPLDKL